MPPTNNKKHESQGKDGQQSRGGGYGAEGEDASIGIAKDGDKSKLAGNVPPSFESPEKLVRDAQSTQAASDASSKKPGIIADEIRPSDAKLVEAVDGKVRVLGSSTGAIVQTTAAEKIASDNTIDSAKDAAKGPSSNIAIGALLSLTKDPLNGGLDTRSDGAIAASMSRLEGNGESSGAIGGDAAAFTQPCTVSLRAGGDGRTIVQVSSSCDRVDEQIKQLQARKEELKKQKQDAQSELKKKKQLMKRQVERNKRNTDEDLVQELARRQAKRVKKTEETGQVFDGEPTLPATGVADTTATAVGVGAKTKRRRK
jgi:hypothetical protein